MPYVPDSTKRKALVWLTVAITLAGFYLRIYYALGLKLGMDDLDHLRLSSGKNIQNVIANSYTDPHPPLRNILLYYLSSISSDPLILRLIGIIPGTLLIPALSFMIFTSTRSFFAALFAATVVSFSHAFVFVSVSTRPYPLTWLMIVLYFYCWHRFTIRLTIKNSCLLMAAGGLVLFADYGSIVMIGAVSIIGLVRCIKINDRYRLLAWCLISFAHTAFFLIQYSLLKMYSNFHVERSHVAPYFLNSSKNPIDIYRQIFKHNFFNASILSDFMLVLSMACVLLCLINRQGTLFFLGVIPVAFVAILSYYSMYPFVPGRWTLQMSLVSLICICQTLPMILKRYPSHSGLIIAAVSIPLILNILTGTLFGSQSHLKWSHSRYNRGPVIDR